MTKVLIVSTKQPLIARCWGDERIEQMVINALEEGGVNVAIGYATNASELQLLINSTKPDLVFPNGYWLLEDQLFPDENTLYMAQSLEQSNVPYVGVNSSVLKNCLPRRRLKEILTKLNIPTPEAIVIDTKDYDLDGLVYPVITKLNFGAESIGVYKVSDELTLKEIIKELQTKYQQPIVVEQWIDCTEYTVGILGNDNERLFLPLQIKLPEGFYYMEYYLKSNKMKEIGQYVTEEGTRLKIENFLSDVCNKLNITDWARFDLIEDKEGNLFVIDLNMLPGLRLNGNMSYFPLCTKTNLDLDYKQTVNMIIYTALKRHNLEIPDAMLKIIESNNGYDNNWNKNAL